ncbi:MAG TPA: HlyD family secretion protein, partial [Longimicrobiales bacterium]|nr:HlyD family secretion protein [Longimicrobiales bacterium]
DGYYALMDWLELPNLRQRSFAYLSALLRRHVLRLHTTLPSVTPRERRIFLTYGTSAVVYSALLLGTVAVLAGGFLVERFGAWGGATVAGGGFVFLRTPLGRLRRGVRDAIIARGLQGRLRRIGALAAAAVVALVLLAAIVPWSVRVRAVAEVEPTQRLWLRAPEAARMVSAPAAEGAEVARGETVAVLRSDALDMERRAAEEAVALAARELGRLGAGPSSEALRIAAIRLAAAREELARVQRREQGLVLVAPFPARLVTPRLDERLGAGLLPGDSVVELWSLEGARVRLAVPQRDAGDLRPGSMVDLRFPHRPGTTWQARVERISPAAQGDRVEAIAPLPAGALETGIRPGMLGRAKVEVERTRVGAALVRWVRRQVRVDLFL